jgi:lipoprotein-anchoring transpeptidase ErfK/SrfK
MRYHFLIAASFLLAGCGRDEPAPQPSPSHSPAPAVDPLASRDGAAADAVSDSEARPIMQAQVVLDRLGFTPGVVDGKLGESTRNAIAGFQESGGLNQTGKLDEPTLAALTRWRDMPATRVVIIAEDFAAGPYYAVPAGTEDQAKMLALGYASLDEKLSERFHTTIETLRMLNPGGRPAGSAPGAATVVGIATATPEPAATATDNSIAQPGPSSLFSAGQQLRVPNVGHDHIDPAAVKDDGWRRTLIALGVGSDQPQATRIVVSRSKGTLKAYNDADKLVAVYTATMGSRNDPLPLGQWKVNVTAYNPDFHYNPKLFWDADPGDKKAKLPPGPNGPVGVVWIDLSKPHYGIHGTPKPETIGRTESHGCVRLTNWDAARLAMMVRPGTKVMFEA